jgi:hypothetical protein
MKRLVRPPRIVARRRRLGSVAICVGIEFGAISSMARFSRSCGAVNHLIGRFFSEALPAVHLTHRDLTRSQQSPEQHRRGFRRGQCGSGLDPPLELFVQTFNSHRRPFPPRVADVSRRLSAAAAAASSGGGDPLEFDCELPRFIWRKHRMSAVEIDMHSIIKSKDRTSSNERDARFGCQIGRPPAAVVRVQGRSQRKIRLAHRSGV